MAKYEIKSITKQTDTAVICHDDYMYPIFKSMSQAYANDWHENGHDAWNHNVGKLYHLTIMGPYTWIELEYPNGLEINMSEDGHIENATYGQKLHLQIPEDWNLIKINIDNKEIELRKNNKK